MLLEIYTRSNYCSTIHILNNNIKSIIRNNQSESKGNFKINEGEGSIVAQNVR